MSVAVSSTSRFFVAVTALSRASFALDGAACFGNVANVELLFEVVEAVDDDVVAIIVVVDVVVVVGVVVVIVAEFETVLTP